MAGNYPDVPDTRIAYDLDGTVGVFVNGAGTPSTLTNANLVTMNDEDANPYTIGEANAYLVLIFPIAMDLTGFFLGGSTNGGACQTCEVSANTTNGVDGTWTTLVASPPWQTASAVAARTNITSASSTAKTAIRWKTANVNSSYYNFSMVHVYGKPNVTTGDRLEIWHPTSDVRLTGAALDWGNVPRSSTADLTFRVKNVSAAKTANGVAVGLDAVTDTSPSVPGQHTLSYNGGAFGATASIGTLAPGAISQVCTVRRTISSTAVLSLWTARVKATATSFT